MTDEPTEAGTRERIVAVVEELMMERGFNAISYQDVAERIGIRKASIHYHFPSKADLGLAVISQYTEKMRAATPSLESAARMGRGAALTAFVGVFANVAASPRKVCLAGVLGAEFVTLPEAMQQEVQRFYTAAQHWLARLLEEGRQAGEFRFEGAGEDVARMIVSSLEGALIISRALGDGRQLESAMRVVRSLVGLASPP